MYMVPKWTFILTSTNEAYYYADRNERYEKASDIVQR